MSTLVKHSFNRIWGKLSVFNNISVSWYTKYIRNRFILLCWKKRKKIEILILENIYADINLIQI